MDYKIGDITKYGKIVEKPFGDGVELIPEFVFHHPDLPNLKLNQFAFDNGDPWKFEGWCTQDGTWNGKRKLRTVKMVDCGVYPEFVLLETNFESDNTVGTVGPRVCMLNNGRMYVAVNENKIRRGAPNGLVEAMRQRHGSTDVKPIATDGVTMQQKEYGVEEIGLLLTNTACIHAETNEGEICLALVRGELTVDFNVDGLPQLNSPFTWIPIGDYLFLSMDDHGQNVVMRNIIAGRLPYPLQEEIDAALEKLPEFVAEQCK